MIFFQFKGRSIFIGGVGTGAKCSRTQFFYDEKLIGSKLFSIPSLIGQQLFLIMIFSNNKKIKNKGTIRKNRIPMYMYQKSALHMYVI